MPSMYAMLSQRRLRWLGHVSRMDDNRIPKDILYGELATGTRPTGRPALRLRDVLKRDLKAGGFDPSELELAASDRSGWRATTRTVIKEAERRRDIRWGEKRARRQQRLQSALPANQPRPAFTCSSCSRACGSRIGLFSHTRRCSSLTIDTKRSQP